MPTGEQTIVLKNPNLGGISDSKYQGVENSMAALVGLDLHSEPGIIKVNQKLVKESGSTVDALANAIVPCSDGNTYLFLANGKIIKRTSSGTYTLERTISGSPAILEAKEYQGYIYYATASNLGRWQVGSAWSGADDTWAAFDNDDSSFHPMHKLNLVLYIGDGKYVAQVEDQSGTHIFSSNALDIKPPLRIKSLGSIGTELLIGTYVNDNVNETLIIRWNTWSKSFSSSDPIPEVGINSFLQTDNFVLAQAGRKGNLYQYSDDVLQQVKRIPGTWIGANRAEVKPNATANILGLPLFGLSNIEGNPALQGVYSFGKTSLNYPSILNLEYVISQDVLSGIEIGAMAYLGATGSTADTLLVAWKERSNYGVDATDANTKYSGAYMDSRIIYLDRLNLMRVADIAVAYRSLPSGTEIKIYVSKNDGAFTEITDKHTDTQHMIVRTEVGVEDCVKFQVRIEFIANGNSAPEVEQVIITI